MATLPSLPLLSEETKRELDVQERRGDALDSKAGIVIGFAGVLVPLSLANLHGLLAHIGAGLAGVAALASALAFIPRSTPGLSLRALRPYLTADAAFTELRLLDTRIAMYERTSRILNTKAWLVTAAVTALGAAVILTVVAGIFYQ